MLKYKSKPAFTLVEVMCSVALFSIMFIGALTTELNTIKLNSYNKQEYNYTLLMEELRNTLIGNTSYSDLKSLINENKIYINKEFLDFNKIRNYKIGDIATSELELGEPYGKLNIIDGKAIEVDLELHIKINEQEDILSCKIYKGNY